MPDASQARVKYCWGAEDERGGSCSCESPARCPASLRAGLSGRTRRDGGAAGQMAALNSASLSCTLGAGRHWRSCQVVLQANSGDLGRPPGSLQASARRLLGNRQATGCPQVESSVPRRLSAPPGCRNAACARAIAGQGRVGLPRMDDVGGHVTAFASSRDGGRRWDEGGTK